MSPIPLFELDYDDAEAAAVAEVLASGWLTMGERVLEFETRFAAMLGGDGVGCLAVANCTAALYMAAWAAGVGPGDEVIVPGLTFVADANVVRRLGAEPVFADCVSTGDLNVDPDAIERMITPRTRAVIVVHFAGYACDMDRLSHLCRSRGIALIEDVAHAPGATWHGRVLGTIGDFGCYSFFSNKNLAVGEGGMIACGDPEAMQRLRLLRSHGMTAQTLDRHNGRAHGYDVALPGLNLRMDEIHAALGTVQLRKLPSGNRRRAEIAARYRRLLADGPIEVPFAHRTDDAPAHHIMPVLLPRGADRPAIARALKAEGIQTSMHYPPFWSFDAYARVRPESMPHVAEVVERELTLPLFPRMTDEQVERCAAALLRVASR